MGNLIVTLLTLLNSQNFSFQIINWLSIWKWRCLERLYLTCTISPIIELHILLNSQNFSCQATWSSSCSRCWILRISRFRLKIDHQLDYQVAHIAEFSEFIVSNQEVYPMRLCINRSIRFFSELLGFICGIFLIYIHISGSYTCDLWTSGNWQVRYGVARLVGSLKLQVSFAEEPYKRDDILQKRPIVSRSLLIVATP